MITPNTIYTSYRYPSNKSRSQIDFLSQSTTNPNCFSPQDVQALHAKYEAEYQSKRWKDNFFSALCGGLGMLLFKNFIGKK